MPAGAARGREPAARSRRPRPSAVPARRLGQVATLLIVVWSLVGLYAVHAQLPTTAFSLPAEERLELTVKSLLPEGWAFFTRDPREPDLLPFARVDGSWRMVMAAPHAEPRNLLGLDRASRAQGVELGLLVASLTEDAWKDCRQQPAACLERLEPLPVGNASPRPTLCGDVGLARVPPVPWAWSHDGADTVMPGQVVRLEATC